MNFYFRYLIYAFVCLGGYFNAYAQKGSKDSLVDIVKEKIEKINPGVYAVGDKGTDLIHIPSTSIIVSLDISSDKRDTSLLWGPDKFPIKKVNNVFTIHQDDNIRDFNKSLIKDLSNSRISESTLTEKTDAIKFKDILKEISLQDANNLKPESLLSSSILNNIISNCRNGDKLGIIDGKFYPVLKIDKSEAIVLGKYGKNDLVSTKKSSLSAWIWGILGVVLGLAVYWVFNKYIQKPSPTKSGADEGNPVAIIVEKVKNNNQKTDVVRLFLALGLEPNKIEAHFVKEKESNFHFSSLLELVNLEEGKNNKTFREEYDQLTKFEQSLEKACSDSSKNLSKILNIIDTKFNTTYEQSVGKLHENSTKYEKLNTDYSDLLRKEGERAQKIKDCADGDFAKIKAYLQDLKIPIKNIKEHKESKSEPVETELEAYFREADTRFGKFLYDFKSKNIDKQEDKRWFFNMLVEMSLHYVDLIESQVKDFSAAEKKFTDANIKLIANRLEKKDLNMDSIDDIDIKPWVIKLVSFLKDIGIEKLENTFARGYEINPEYLKPESGQPRNMVRYFTE